MKTITIDYDEYLEMERVYKIFKKPKPTHCYNEKIRAKKIGDRDLFNLLCNGDYIAEKMDKIIVYKSDYLGD